MTHGYEQGIIPALAGNTPKRRPLNTVDGDHPRSRGEYALQLDDGCHESGSSPLSRGILTWSMRPLWTWRIIPALAGNT